MELHMFNSVLYQIGPFSRIVHLTFGPIEWNALYKTTVAAKQFGYTYYFVYQAALEIFIISPVDNIHRLPYLAFSAAGSDVLYTCSCNRGHSRPCDVRITTTYV